MDVLSQDLMKCRKLWDLGLDFSNHSEIWHSLQCRSFWNERQQQWQYRNHNSKPFVISYISKWISTLNSKNLFSKGGSILIPASVWGTTHVVIVRPCCVWGTTHVVIVRPCCVDHCHRLITPTPYMVLPLFATRFAAYAGGIRDSFIQPRLF